MAGRKRPWGSRAASRQEKKRASWGKPEASQLEALRRFVLSAPPEQLAGSQREQLRGAKISELLQAARSGRLTAHDVATFAQSVHPALLAVFERGSGLPHGFFLSVTRAVQLAGGNPFLQATSPDVATARRMRAVLARRLEKIVALHHRRGGWGLPQAVQFLTSSSHLTSQPGKAGYRAAVREAVEGIPLPELQRRHAYILKLSPEQVIEQMPRKKDLDRHRELVSFDHLLGTLGKVTDGKLLIEIYAENMPAPRGRFARFLPVTALGEGSYCVDDIARTTVALLQAHQRTKDPKLLEKAMAGISFVKMMQAKDGEFFNFAAVQNGKIMVNRNGATSKKGIDFWAARALWALGEGYASMARSNPEAASSLAAAIQRTLPRLEAPLKRYGQYRSTGGARLPDWLINGAADQTAVMLKGLLAYYRALPRGMTKERVARIITRYCEGLERAQVKDPAAPDRGRFYHSMANPGDTHMWGSRQVEVLAEAGRLLGRKDWIRSASICADHYWSKHGPATLVGPGEEQIAYGIESVVSGFARLHEATGSQRFADQTFRWATWLFGKNQARTIMYDPVSGRGYDGIARFTGKGKPGYSVNGNAGAESTVEAILALQSASRVPGVIPRLHALLREQLPE